MGKQVESKTDKITKRSYQKENRERISLYKSWDVGKLLTPKAEIL